LLKFVDSPPVNVPADAVTLIRTEACRALTLGFVVFYPLPSQQIQFVLETFEKKQAQLLNPLLSELADWYRVADVLNEDAENPLKASKKDQLKERDIKVRNEIYCFRDGR